MSSVFELLNAIDVSAHVEKKNNLNYLSWAWAWAELKKHYPRSLYTIYHNKDDWNYFTDGRTCWVRTGVTVVDEETGDVMEYVEELPVMDYKNNAVPLDQVTSTLVNKTIQRSLTKAIARHGLGLYLYAGEDLPEAPANEKPDTGKPVPVKPAADKPAAAKPAPAAKPTVTVSSTVKPVAAPEKPQEQPRVIAMNQAKARAAIVRKLCNELSITEEQFGTIKRLCTFSGEIGSAKVADLTDEEFSTLLDFARRNADLSA